MASGYIYSISKWHPHVSPKRTTVKTVHIDHSQLDNLLTVNGATLIVGMWESLW